MNENLKDLLINYVGNKLNPQNDEVTIEMIVTVLAAEAPDVLLHLAEENWFRGYEQGVQDTMFFEE